jgi:hypothetical protein
MNYKILTPLILLFLVNPLYAVDESGAVSDPINSGPSLAQEETVPPLNVPTNKVIDSAAQSEAGGKSVPFRLVKTGVANSARALRYIPPT